MLKTQYDAPSQGSDKLPKYSMNALPCRVGHNGPLSVHPRYWSPRTAPQAPDTSPQSSKPGGREVLESYFRGRKLLSCATQLPAGYKAVLLQKRDETIRDTTLKDKALSELEDRRSEMGPEEYEEEMAELRKDLVDGSMVEELGVAKQIGDMDDAVMVWGHEAVADADDEWVGRMNEWALLSHAVCSLMTSRKCFTADETQIHGEGDAPL